MAIMKKHSEYDEDIRAMKQAYAKPAISDEQRMHLAFGLGKAFEDLHQYEMAFGFFAEGNSINEGVTAIPLMTMETSLKSSKRPLTFLVRQAPRNGM